MALEIAGKIGGGALVAEDHGDQRDGIAGPRDNVAVALVGEEAEREHARGGGSQPAEAEGGGGVVPDA